MPGGVLERWRGTPAAMAVVTKPWQGVGRDGVLDVAAAASWVITT
jgi:hypothetical protein